MFTDIAFPRNNEGEFAETASKLGIKKLYFVYDFNEYNEEKIQKKLDALKQNGISTKAALLVNQKNMDKAMRHSKLLVVKSSDKDRFFIESKKIKLVYAFEETNKKDYINQRASGLNHITCEIARNNNVAIGFCYSSLLNKNDQAILLLIGRMIQNISLCRKYRVKTIIGSFSEKPLELRAPYDIISLFAILGMDSKIVRDSLKTEL